MNDYYSIGQSAAELEVPNSKIRALAEAGLLDGARRNESGHWRIPIVTVQRVKGAGVPQIPRSLEPSTPLRRRPDEEPDLLAPASDALMEATEKVHLLKRGAEAVVLRRTVEEGEDWFREREAAKKIKAVQSAAELEQNRAARKRTEWISDNVGEGLQQIPNDAPPESWNRVKVLVEKHLQNCDPDQSLNATQVLIQAAVKEALEPWRRDERLKQEAQKEKGRLKGVVEAAVNLLPYSARTWGHDGPVEAQAAAAAWQAIRALGESASQHEQEVAAVLAVQPFKEAAIHAENITIALSTLSRRLPTGYSQAELEQGKRAAGDALKALPVGASSSDLNDAVVAAIKPIVLRVAARLDTSMREQIIQEVGRIILYPRVPVEHAPAIRAAVTTAFSKHPQGTAAEVLCKIRDTIIDQARAEYRVHQAQQESQNKQMEERARAADWALRWDLPDIMTEIEKGLDSEGLELDPPREQLITEFRASLREPLISKLSGADSREQTRKLLRKLVKAEIES